MMVASNTAIGINGFDLTTEMNDIEKFPKRTKKPE